MSLDQAAATFVLFLAKSGLFLLLLSSAAAAAFFVATSLVFLGFQHFLQFSSFLHSIQIFYKHLFPGLVIS